MNKKEIIKDLLEALEVIEERCNQELGEWAPVEYAHLPVRLSVFWFLREEARTAIAKATGK